MAAPVKQAHKQAMPAKAIPHQFKPGQSGNPKGRPPLNPIQRALKNLTVKTYADVIELILTGNIDAVKEMISDNKTPAIQVGLATAFLKAIQRGDYQVMENIAARIVGRIPDKVDLSVKGRINLGEVDMAKVALALKKLDKDI